MDQHDIYATIDEIERDEHGVELAVLVFDDAQQLSVPAPQLPDGARAGAVLTLRFELARGEQDRRLARVRELQSRLFGSQMNQFDTDNREPE